MIKLEVGDTVATCTSDLFMPFVRVKNEQGSTMEIPAKITGEVVEIDKTKKENDYSVGVLFTFQHSRGEQQITLYLRPRSLISMKQ